MRLIRSFTTRREVIGVLCAMMLIFPSTGVLAQGSGQQAGNGLTIPITGTIDGVLGNSFVGTFELQRFAVVNGVLSAVGRLTGALTVGGVTTSIVRTLTIPVSNLQAACDILHLELGPLDLNLLGVVVHLNQIVLDIDAQPGPGNLLGNLLCAVAGLLDNPAGALAGVAQLLNQILAILG